jgi:hypothetical protein
LTPPYQVFPLADFVGLVEDLQAAQAAVGLYPIVTLQYSSTTLYQVSYHVQYLLF